MTNDVTKMYISGRQLSPYEQVFEVELGPIPNFEIVSRPILVVVIGPIKPHANVQALA